MLSEFSLIDKFFKQKKHLNSHTHLGIGDDCALLSIPTGYELAITTDTMVENVHFFAEADPAQLGHKLLAVNLSDLAAMGAKPIAVTLVQSGQGLIVVIRPKIKAVSTGTVLVCRKL